MVDYVLDTHAAIFALAAPHKLGQRARQGLARVEAGDDRAWIPAAVVAEIVMLRELRRIEIGLPELQQAFEAAPGLSFLPLDLRQLQDFAALAALRDPFDRLIVSAARVLGARLVSKDARIAECGLVATIW